MWDENEQTPIDPPNNLSQIQKIISSFQQFVSKLSFKNSQLLNHILKTRKAAISLISNHLKRKYLY